MANLTQGFGAVPVQTGPGSTPKCQPGYFQIPASVTTPIYPGDPVISNGTGATTGIPQVVAYTAGGGTGIKGFVAQVFDANYHPLPDPNSSASSMAGTGSTVRYCTLYDTSLTFLMREDSDASSLAVTDIGANVDMVAVASNAGNAVENTSGWRVDSSSKATTATLPLRIEGFEPTNRENDATLANKIVRVTINNVMDGV